MRKYIVQGVLLIVCIIIASIIIIPFLIMLVNSFKDIREAALFQLSLPTEWIWSNYVDVFMQANILRAFGNSVLISGVTVACIIFIGPMAAFVIQRRYNKFLKYIYFLFILGLIVPVAIVPTIRVMQVFHIDGTYLSIIMYYTATMLPFAIFLLTGFMKSIPRELDEAAYMEGSSFMKMYFKIIFPLISPIVVTVTIIVMINVWNDFTGSFYLISDASKWPIVLLVYRFLTMYNTHWGVVFAFMMIVIIPIIIVYLILQKKIISGLTSGSVKG